MNDLSPTEEQRERTVESLSTGYAQGMLEVEELERRLALVHTARNAHELDVLVTDVVGASTSAATTTALVAARDMRILFGSIARTGPWAVPQQLRARVVCGNLELDLREARLVAGVTTIEVDVTMGSVEVIVPPGYQVDVDASSYLGAVDERTERVSAAPTSIIRIVGRVRLGHLEVLTLHRGETRRDARRRRRADRMWRRRRMLRRTPWEVQ